jgi:hypothetical protein
MYYSHADYKFLRFEKSKKEGKKYNAVLIRRTPNPNKKTGREVRVPFGDKNYEQYKDTTGLGLYSHLNHLDSKRRTAYRIRHAKDGKALPSKEGYYSPGAFSMSVLWT